MIIEGKKLEKKVHMSSAYIHFSTAREHDLHGKKRSKSWEYNQVVARISKSFKLLMVFCLPYQERPAVWDQAEEKFCLAQGWRKWVKSDQSGTFLGMGRPPTIVYLKGSWDVH